MDPAAAAAASVGAPAGIDLGAAAAASAAIFGGTSASSSAAAAAAVAAGVASAASSSTGKSYVQCTVPKGQLISKCLFGVIVSTKIATKIL